MLAIDFNATSSPRVVQLLVLSQRLQDDLFEFVVVRVRPSFCTAPGRALRRWSGFDVGRQLRLFLVHRPRGPCSSVSASVRREVTPTLPSFPFSLRLSPSSPPLNHTSYGPSPILSHSFPFWRVPGPLWSTLSVTTRPNLPNPCSLEIFSSTNICR